MKKRNQKGMTSIELLVCFVMISGIVVSMFSLIMNYKNKEQIASIQNEVIQYGNNLQKLIQDDLIKKELQNVNITDDKSATFAFSLDSTTTEIKINPSVISDSGEVEERGSIQYGSTGSMLRYDIPNLADLVLTDNSSIVIDGQMVKITLYLEHPNFEQPYRIRIICPLNYNSA